MMHVFFARIAAVRGPSLDVRFCRLKTVPALIGLFSYNENKLKLFNFRPHFVEMLKVLYQIMHRLVLMIQQK